MTRSLAPVRGVGEMSDDELIGAMLRPRDRNPAPRTGPGLPRCPGHLTAHGAKEWRRVARLLHDMGVLTAIDRAALAAYCQAWGRWVEAEEKLQETPILVRTPSGYVQQSPWISIANKQLELMGRYMVELGMTPSSRRRVSVLDRTPTPVVQTSGAHERLSAMIDAIAERLAYASEDDPQT